LASEDFAKLFLRGAHSWAKFWGGQNFSCRLLKYYTREARHPATLDFFNFGSGSGQIVLINKLILDASGWRLGVGSRQPQTSRTRIKISKKPADQGRREVEPCCPQQGER